MADVEPESSGSGRRRTVAVVIAVALIAGVAGTAFALNSEDDENSAQETTTTSNTALVSSTTTSPVPVSTTGPVRSIDTSSAVWPYVESPTRYLSAESAAKGFATEFLHFRDPRFGELQQGDSRSGEIGVRPAEKGPVTTIFVRQLEDNSWWVIGAATPNIQISEPTALTSISSPVRLTGTSTAYEANVQTEVRQHGSTTPLAEGFVMGGSMGELGPFDGTLAFPRPTASSGAVVLYTESAENGQVWEASVVRVNFAG